MDTEKFDLNRTENEVQNEEKKRFTKKYVGCYTSLLAEQREKLYGRLANKGATLKWVLVGLFLLSDKEFKEVTDKLELAHTRNNERLKAAS